MPRDARRTSNIRPASTSRRRTNTDGGRTVTTSGFTGQPLHVLHHDLRCQRPAGQRQQFDRRDLDLHLRAGRQLHDRLRQGDRPDLHVGDPRPTMRPASSPRPPSRTAARSPTTRTAARRSPIATSSASPIRRSPSPTIRAGSWSAAPIRPARRRSIPTRRTAATRSSTTRWSGRPIPASRCSTARTARRSAPATRTVRRRRGTYPGDGSFTIAYTKVTGEAYTGFTVSYGTDGRPTGIVFSNNETATWTYPSGTAATPSTTRWCRASPTPRRR